jgi:hypothetical protein
MPTGIYPKEFRRKFLTEEHKRKIGKANTGKKMSPEHHAKLLAISTGRKASPEEVEKRASQLRGRKYSLEHRKKISQGHKKKVEAGTHHLWKGGVSDINHHIRESGAYKEWRMAVYKRDDFRCLDCGEKGKYLNADHIYPFALYPRLRFDINNGRTLCEECHYRTPTFGSKFNKYKKSLLTD